MTKGIYLGVKKRKSILFVLSLLAVIMISSGNIFACSIFSALQDGANFFASNEDFYFKDPVVCIEPGNKKNYSYIVFGWESYYPSYPQGGVNEKGVCLDWATVPSQKFIDDPTKKQLDEDIFMKILKNCANVSEAIDLISKYNCSHFAEEHLLIADREGNSVVVEWNGSEVVFIKREGNYQVITNFNISNPKLGWYPCNRFDKINDNFKSNKAPITFDFLKDTLNDTHQEGEYPTIYSYIVNTKDMTITIYFQHNYDKRYILKFNDVLKKGRQKIKLFQPNLYSK